MNEPITRCGTLSILGRPNVGKSTLLNTLIGEKVSIVSPKPQTTRNRIVGVLTEGGSQFVFMDTPGLHSSKSKLGDAMVRTIYETAAGVNAAILVIEPGEGEARVGKPEALLLEKIKSAGIPALLAINKVDKLEKAALLPWIKVYSEAFPFTDIVPVSARTGDGTDVLLACAKKLLPELGEGESPLFDSDALTDQPERVLAAELVREKLLRHLEREIPHGVACVTEAFTEREDGVTEISVLIVCEKASHKGIIIGRQGAMLKTVGSEARADMEKLLDCKVFLTLWVRVKDDWRNNDFMLRDFGFDA